MFPCILNPYQARTSQKECILKQLATAYIHGFAAHDTVHQWFCSLHCYMSVTIPYVIPVYNNYCLHVIVNSCRDIYYGVDMQAVHVR